MDLPQTATRSVPLLELRDLRIRQGRRTLVAGVDVTLYPGECVAIVGESGAGKSLTARSLLGLLPAGLEQTCAALTIAGTDARRLRERRWRHIRGSDIALVSQDALVSLDPLRTVGAEVGEPLAIHRLVSGGQRRERVRQLLSRVSMPEPQRRSRQYPHELSGGLRQRALIASALAAEPRVLIADEPTTALDATVQSRILSLLHQIIDEGTALLLISHDFTAVRRIADRVIVMREGQVVEEGSAAQVLQAPRHPYTRELIAATALRPRPQSAPGAQMLRIRNLGRDFSGTPAVRSASFDVSRGRTLGIVGESGSGKTTLARLIIGVERPSRGEMTWVQESRPRVQLVHQNPLGAFDPRWSIGRSLREALEAGGIPRAARALQVSRLLTEVGLEPELARRRPAELSGGQRQRAALARALAAEPDLLILDEPVSALDPTVRTRILELLAHIQHERGLTMIMISHDLAVVSAVCDDLLVMKEGDIVESGTVVQVLSHPQHPFTRELIDAAQ